MLAMNQRINLLLKLEEERSKTKQIFSKHQSTVKKWFDTHKSTEREFEIGDLVLKWDKINEKEGKHTKFQSLWLGPYQIAEKFRPRSFLLQTLEGDVDHFPTNGIVLKHYFT